MGWLLIVVFFFFVLPALVRFLTRTARPSGLDVLLTMGKDRRRWGDDWGQVLSPHAPDRVTCPSCGANNFPTEAACWQCQRPLPTLRTSGGAYQHAPAGTRAFQIRQVTYDRQTCIQFTDRKGRRHIFRSWAEAPPAVLQEIERLPEPMRSTVRAQMGLAARAPGRGTAPPTPPPLLPGQGPRQPTTAPQPSPPQPAPPESAAQPEEKPAQGKQQERPDEEETPWIEL